MFNFNKQQGEVKPFSVPELTADLKSKNTLDNQGAMDTLRGITQESLAQQLASTPEDRKGEIVNLIHAKNEAHRGRLESSLSELRTSAKSTLAFIPLVGSLLVAQGMGGTVDMSSLSQAALALSVGLSSALAASGIIGVGSGIGAGISALREKLALRKTARDTAGQDQKYTV